MKKLIGLLILLSIVSCGEKAKKKPHSENFVFATWTKYHGDFDKNEWTKKLDYYENLGVTEVLIEASPEVLKKIVPMSNKRGFKIHGWMWTLNRPNDTIANKHPKWYAVNRKGQNSLEHRAYVDYYQWLSPFHPEARAYIINNAKKMMAVEGLASVHLDYVRFPDVILGDELQPKYNIVQDGELPEYDYGYHPIAIEGYKKIFDKDPREIRFPELSDEWRQYRLNAVTSLVNEIIDIAHRQKQKVSAAVFPFPELARNKVRQAWNDWNLDAVFPMIYHSFYLQNINWIGYVTEQDVKDVLFPLYSGLYLPGFKHPRELERAIYLCRDSGASGVSIFTLDDLSPEYISLFKKFKKAELKIKK